MDECVFKQGGGTPTSNVAGGAPTSDGVGGSANFRRRGGWRQLQTVWRGAQTSDGVGGEGHQSIITQKVSVTNTSRGMLVLLVSVQILVHLDCFSHSITMEV